MGAGKRVPEMQFAASSSKRYSRPLAILYDTLSQAANFTTLLITVAENIRKELFFKELKAFLMCWAWTKGHFHSSKRLLQRLWRIGVVGSLYLLVGACLMAAPQEETDVDDGFPNIKTPTLGGKQLWTDHLWRQGWRVQQNAMTGHWRLLDPNNMRHAWGTRLSCEAALEDAQPDNKIVGAEVVILLHGLLRTTGSLMELGEHIEEKTGITLLYFQYASTRTTISEHASALREVVAGLPADTKIRFVGHSMGNIVVRHALGDWQRAGDRQTLDRVQQVIMLGPPNHGASLARQLAKTSVFGWIVGRGGLELGPQWNDFEANLAIPHCPFGIIAGHIPETYVQNPLVEGASDFIVTVDEARLPGAADFLEVPHMHSFLMEQTDVQPAVVAFLQKGSFH
jgi:pimeloyl-ACP methyl ester carboxylesterase